MSVAAKRTLGGSIFVTIVTIIGVHYAQKVESENMYQGVVKDKLRREQRALDKADGGGTGSLTTLAYDSSSPASSRSPVPQSIRGFDAPVAALPESRTDEQKARDRLERQMDFERSQERDKRLSREQGVGNRE